MLYAGAITLSKGGTMPRAPFALILVLVAALAGCDREAPKPPPAPAPVKAAAPHVKEAPPQAEEPPPPPVDLAGLDEDAALVALMKHEVTADDDPDQQALARFAATDADTLLAKPSDLLPDYLKPTDAAAAAELAQSSLQLVEQQVPADIRNAIRAGGKVKVLMAEGCGADVGTVLGVPNDYDEGSAQQYLDQARFDLALEREKTKSIALPADFRDMEGDQEAIAAVNRQLFDLHRSGKTTDILVVIDLSAGCATEDRQVTLVTDPPFESLRILPAFYFTVCSQRAEDAWAPELCRWWEGVTQPLTMDQGTYYYVAKWPDGLEKRGRFVIDDLVTEAIEEGQDTLTLDIR
jgi:hypothetical protein